MTEGNITGKALLVEDETLVAMIAEDLLLAIGYEPVCVDSGAAALDHLQQGGYDVAVIDVGLPDMRGDDLAARLRLLHPDLAIVLASGYDEAEFRRRFADDDRIAFLGKPYVERGLRAAIASVTPSSETA